MQTGNCLLVFLSAERMHEEHHEGLGPLRCSDPVLPQDRSRSTSEPNSGDYPGPEEGVFITETERNNHDLKTERARISWEITLTKSCLVFTQKCSPMADGDNDASEVFFSVSPSLFLICASSLSLKEEKWYNRHRGKLGWSFYFLSVKLAVDYCVFLLCCLTACRGAEVEKRLLHGQAGDV